jgi:large subunit ribosomal protein L32e
MSDIERLLRKRSEIKQKRPKFKRQESWRYKRIHEPWRKPKGLDNKVRQKRKGFIKMPNIGHRSPRIVRGYHPSGKRELLAQNIKILESYDPNEYIVRISSKLGLPKKLNIFEKAEELGFKVINVPIIEKEEPEKWEKLMDLEREEIEPEFDEKYVESLEEEGDLEGLPEFEITEEKGKKPKKEIKKKPEKKKVDKKVKKITKKTTKKPEKKVKAKTIKKKKTKSDTSKKEAKSK